MGQYGNKDRYEAVPIGDTLKAAASDALKKCASLLGIALDVYWPELDRAEKKVKEKDLPREYLIPDMVKIRRDALTGVKIAGVEVREVKTVAGRFTY